MRYQIFFIFSLFILGCVQISEKYDSISGLVKTTNNTTSITENPKTIVSYEHASFEWSEGSCSNANQCIAVEYGCGGGHIVCTSNPNKWKDIASTCDIVTNHPSQLGYECTCISDASLCGWVLRGNITLPKNSASR